MNVDDLIDKAQQIASDAAPETRNVILGGEWVSVRLTKLRGDQWRDLIAQHPPRAGFMDQNLGYNLDAVTAAYPRVAIVHDGEVDDLRRTDEEGTVYVWPRIAQALEAPALETIGQALFEMHQLNPLQEMIAAGKASRGGRVTKPRSPESSASQSGS